MLKFILLFILLYFANNLISYLKLKRIKRINLKLLAKKPVTYHWTKQRMFYISNKKLKEVVINYINN